MRKVIAAPQISLYPAYEQDLAGGAGQSEEALASRCPPGRARLALANSWEGQSVSRDPASVGRNAAHRTWAA